MLLPFISLLRSSLTGTSLRPFSPGGFVELVSLMMPESDATGASPGAGASLCAGALAAPRPLAKRGA